MISKKIVSIDFPKNRNSKLMSELEMFIQSNLEGEPAFAPISLKNLITKLGKQQRGFKLMLKKNKQNPSATTQQMKNRYYKSQSVSINQSNKKVNKNNPYELGMRHYNKKNYHKAMKLLKKAAQQGCTDATLALNNLGKKYQCGDEVEINTHKAFECYQIAANQGDLHAQYNLGNMYFFGTNGTQDYGIQDYRLSYKWYKKAAEQGHVTAQYNLGWQYETANGTQKNINEAMKWFKKAAQQGCKDASLALNNLGAKYQCGDEVEINTHKAFECYQIAANQGNLHAQYNLGSMYFSGTNGTQDYHLSYEWYKKAAKQGHVTAQYHLGWQYETANGVAKNIAEAVKWYQKAASQGNEDAMKALTKFN